MTRPTPSRYKLQTRQALITYAEVVDQTSGEIIASGETTLNSEEIDYSRFPGNDQKLAKEIASGRAFKQLLQSRVLTENEQKAQLAGSALRDAEREVYAFAKGFDVGVDATISSLRSTSPQAREVLVRADFREIR